METRGTSRPEPAKHRRSSSLKRTAALQEGPVRCNECGPRPGAVCGLDFLQPSTSTLQRSTLASAQQARIPQHVWRHLSGLEPGGDWYLPCPGCTRTFSSVIIHRCYLMSFVGLRHQRERLAQSCLSFDSSYLIGSRSRRHFKTRLLTSDLPQAVWFSWCNLGSCGGNQGPEVPLGRSETKALCKE